MNFFLSLAGTALQLLGVALMGSCLFALVGRDRLDERDVTVWTLFVSAAGILVGAGSAIGTLL